jgi:hypothetical protein
MGINMKSTYDRQSVFSNSFTALAVGVLVTGLMFGSVEIAHEGRAASGARAASEAHGDRVVKLDPIVVTAKRLQKTQG